MKRYIALILILLFDLCVLWYAAKSPLIFAILVVVFAATLLILWVTGKLVDHDPYD